MLSLRFKLVAPLMVIALLAGVGTWFAVTAALQLELSRLIRSDLHLLASLPPAAKAAPRTLVPRSEAEAVERRERPLFVEADTDGKLLLPAGSDALLRGFLTTIADLPPPESFRDQEYVGQEVTQGSGPRTAIVVSTRPYRALYREVAASIVFAAGGITVALIAAGAWLASWIARRVEQIRRTATDPGTPIVTPSGLPPVGDELTRLDQDVRATVREARRTADEVARLQVVRSQFLGNVSHEVRTPLFALKGSLETLLEGADNDPAARRAFLEKSMHQAHRLDALLRDLIEISRIESGDMKMSFRTFEPEELFGMLRADMSDEAARTGHALTFTHDLGDRKIIGDRQRLRQALVNLIENALRYTPSRSTVDVSIRARGEAAVVRVADNGPGIPAEHVPRIFERFYRVDADRSREKGGTGLGLSIVKHIIEAHGSVIAVETRPGGGTVFSFTLKM